MRRLVWFAVAAGALLAGATSRTPGGGPFRLAPRRRPGGPMRRLVWFAVAAGALLAGTPSPAGATPVPVRAWYIYGTTQSGLESAAYDHGCAYAESHPG